jgi:DNA mismatch repair protein MutL
MQDDGYKSAAERFSRAEPGTEKSPQHAMRHDTTRSAQSKYAGHRADSSGLAYKNRDAFYPPRGDVREAVSPYLPLARTAEREGAPAYDSGSAVDADTDAGAAASFFDEGVFAGARVTGCFGFNYWVCEQGDAILIVDQHAAHERVVYERFKKEYSAGGIRRQGLLIPISFTPHEGEREIIEEQGAAIREAGFSLAPFGKQNWIIDEYPAEVKDVLPALRSLLASLAESRDSEDTRRERVLATLACHAAVRRGDRIQAAFVCEILNELAALKKPFTCPHGRPSIVRFGKEEIEKWFARR